MLSHAYATRMYAVGQSLLMLRTRARLTQSELGELLNVHRRSVQKWECGEAYPKAERLRALIALYLARGIFTSGRERDEAEALWQEVSEHAPQPLPRFDVTWFTHLSAQQQPERAAAPRSLHAWPIPAAQETSHALIDWGEAVAVRTLYGRDDELATLGQWIVADRCRVIHILGLGGIGKSSLAITLAERVIPEFDVVLFRSLQDGPPLAELLDHAIRTVSDHQVVPAAQLGDKIAQLIVLFRERRCLVILDNFESIMQPGVLTGTYRTGYADYGVLLQRLGERAHQSCLLLTSREKPAEIGRLEGNTAPVRSLPLAGLDEEASRMLLESKDIVGAATDLHALAQRCGGNPLVLNLLSEPIREVFAGDVGAFLAAGVAFVDEVGTLLQQQFVRSTPLEQDILYWLAIAREPVPLHSVLGRLHDAVSYQELIRALESLRRRLLIAHSADQQAFTLQPVICEYLTGQLVEAMQQEIIDGQPYLLVRHALLEATAKDYVRRSQERLIAAPLLERLLATCGSAEAVEQRLTALLARWRGRPSMEQGYGPGNSSNLLRLLRGDLDHLDLSNLLIKQLYLQGFSAHDTSLAGSHLLQAVLQEPFAGLESLACTPDMRYLALGTVNGEVRVVEVATRTMLLVVQSHTAPVNGLALSVDGRLLASGSTDGTVQLWDVATATCQGLLEHAPAVHGIALSADGQLLASAGGDGTVRLWDVPGNACLAVLEGHTHAVSGVALSADGQLLASGSFDGTVRLWDTAMALHGGMGHLNCLAVLADHTAGVYGVALSADGGVLASGSFDRTVRVWDTAAALRAAGGVPPCLATLHGHGDAIRGVALAADGSLVASASGDKTVRLWDIRSGACVAVLDGHTSGVWGVALSADGQLVASGGTDGTARLCAARDGASLTVIQGHPNAIMSVALAPDGQLLASGSRDGTIRLWDIRSGACLHCTYEYPNMVTSLAFSPNGQLLASGGGDGVIRLWDLRGSVCRTRLEGHSEGVRDIAWSADGRLLASGGTDATVRLWDVHRGSSLGVLRGHTNMVVSVAFSPDGRLLASGSGDSTIRLWDTASVLDAGAGSGTCTAELNGHAGAVWSVALSADGRLLASAGSDGTVRLWDVRSGTCTAELDGHAGAVWSVALSADGWLLASAGIDSTVRLWDVRSGTCTAELDGHAGAVWSVALSADGQLLASAGSDGTVRLWDGRQSVPLRTLRPEWPYERLDISAVVGLSAAQRTSLLALGAVEGGDARPRSFGNGAKLLGGGVTLLPTVSGAADDAQHLAKGQRTVLGLPFQPTPFVGRSSEVAAIEQLLANPTCRLLTLLGPGGIGKTRLAIEVATAQAERYADGVTFVALASVGTREHIVSAIGATLGLAFRGQSDSRVQLIDYLRTRSMLLLLDNLEHLLALEGVDLIHDILTQAPGVTMLVTSRERLHFQAEWLFDVAGLAYPPVELRELDAPDQMIALIDYSAIQLFVQRVRQIQPTFVVTPTVLATMVRICRSVAGMPLAIELAAAGVRSLPLAAIEQQIRASLDGLTTRLADVPARHRSLRAVFDHSWNLLSEGERVLWSQLAVFHSGWTAEAAEQVVGATLPVLTRLVDKSLVQHSSVETPLRRERAGANAVLSPRFVLLEPLREYALEHLAARGEAAALRCAHAHYYLALAEAAAAQWETPLLRAALAQLEREHDNLRAALQWACDNGQSTLELRLAVALRKFWQCCGAISEGRVWLTELLALRDDAHHANETTGCLRATECAAG